MLKKMSRPARKVSIVVLVSVALASVVTLVLLAFALWFYNADSARRWNQLHQALTISAEQLAVAVALPTWNFDESQIIAVMKSGLNNRDLYGSVVEATANTRTYTLMRDAHGELAAGARPAQAAGLLAETRPVLVAGQAIGYVTVYATSAYVLEELRQRRLAIMAVILVLDAVLVLSVYLLLWFLVLKPLKAVGHYAAQLEAGHCMGAAPARRTWFLGELKTLNEAIHRMVALLDSRYRALMVGEERLSIATSAAGIGIWDWDIAGNALVWDQQMYRQYRIDPARFGGAVEAWAAAVLPQDRPGVDAALAAAMRGEGEYSAEFRIAWPDGEIRHIKADSRTFRDAHGAAQRMVGVNYDITDARHAEQELLRHRNHLEELVAARTVALSVAVTEARAANRAKSVFLATMSHELRTPLNSVIGFSRLMADSQTMSAEEKRNLAIIHRSGQHLLTLINDILDLSKIEAGGARLQASVVELDDLLHEVIEMVSERARAAGLTLALDCAGLPHAVQADGVKLRQVLLNLMSNAVKFAGRGGVTLEVRGRAAGAARHTLVFAVRDSGIGIAAADQQRIFEPFVQADSVGPQDGTGLGLAISREFVRMMGGELTVESAPGRGAVFRFAFDVEAGTSARAPDRSAPRALAGQGKRILVVDDNQDSCTLLAGVLGPLGFEVDEAADGQAALNALGRTRYDLVFMDWRMPGADGLAVMRRLRADPDLVQPSVVMLTASAFEEDRQEALSAGADDFLRKPIEHDKLFLVIEQQLKLPLRRSERVASAAAPEPVSAADLQRLPLAVRDGLHAALLGLQLARVAHILEPLRHEHAALVGAIEHMLSQHRYPQLCGLIDAARARS